MSADAPDTLQLLSTTLEAVGHGNAVLITDSAGLREPLARTGVTLLATEDAESRLDDLPRTALAIVDGAARFPSEPVAVQLVGRLRDLHADRVLVIAAHRHTGHLDRHALIGLGFQRWASSQDPAGRRRWYEFDMAHYKTTPDWLNPRNWANPELWDKYRW